ncbi:MAG TPA: DUF58 domain-containing protein [Candidatus Absconditabacterales bacterium]|nr:DUF58 domain-containing protein [Candidatus Absconditabacterales bacterium]
MLRHLLKIKKIIQGSHSNIFQSLQKGSGLEIIDFRKYQDGDDFRSINRKMSAKFNQLFVDLYRQEKDIERHILRDINRNRLGGTTKPFHEIAKHYMQEIIFIAKKTNCPVTLYYPSQKKLVIKPLRKNRSGLIGSLSRLSSLSKKSPKNYFSALSPFLIKQKTLTKRHGIIIFSDGLSRNKELENIRSFLNKKNHCIFLELPVPLSTGINFENRTTKIPTLKPKNGFLLTD